MYILSFCSTVRRYT